MRLTEHFDQSEFECHCGKCDIPVEALHNLIRLCNNLEKVRAKIGKPIEIVSGYRCPAHNKKVAGAKKSEHMNGNAADITVEGLTPEELHKNLSEMMKNKEIIDGGLGLYSGWVHYDIAKKRRWNG